MANTADLRGSLVPEMGNPREHPVVMEFNECSVKAPRKTPPLSVMLWGLALVLAVGQTWRTPVTLDDAYITYRYARNFSRGDGLTFNPGEAVLATTAPGLAVLLAGLTRAGMETVTAGRLLDMLGLLLACGGLAALGWLRKRPAAGLAAGFILCFMPDLVRAWGNECPLLTGLFVMGWLALELRRPALGAVAMALGCMVRPDFALAALLFAPFWWRRSRREFAWYAMMGLGLSLAWLAALVMMHVSPLPHSLAVKRMQGLWIATGDPRAFAGWISFRRGLFWFLRRTVFDVPAGALALIGAVLMLRLPRLYPLILWCGLHVGVYYLLGVPGHYFWYYYPLWLGVAVAMGEAIALLGEAVQAGVRDRAGADWARVSVTLGLALFGGFYYMGHSRDGLDLEKSQAYQAMAALIRQDVPAGQSVMMNEIGEMGYYADYRVVDTHGLIHPDLPAALVGDTPAIVARFKPDFIVLEGWLDHAGPDYRPRVLAGDYTLSYAAGEGHGAVEYRQVGRAAGFEHYLPVLLARQATEPRPEPAPISPGVEHSPQN